MASTKPRYSSARRPTSHGFGALGLLPALLGSLDRSAQGCHQVDDLRLLRRFRLLFEWHAFSLTLHQGFERLPIGIGEVLRIEVAGQSVDEGLGHGDLGVGYGDVLGWCGKRPIAK